MKALRRVASALLAATLFALIGTVSAAPVSYTDVGTIIDSSYAGVNPGDPISIVITYDPTTGPPSFDVSNDGTMLNVVQDLNGDIVSQPWAPWMSVTANFDGYTWRNDIAGTYLNYGNAGVADGLNCGPSCFEDYDYSFFVEQASDPDFNNGFLFGIWFISAQDTINPGLTNGVSLMQPIDPSMGAQSGQLYRTQQGQVEFVDFVLTQVNVPTSVPEPITLTLLGIGLAGLGFARRRKPT